MPALEAAAPPAAAATGWDDVDVAFELIPEVERPSWLKRAREALREQGTPWLESCVPVLRSLAVQSAPNSNQGQIIIQVDHSMLLCLSIACYTPRIWDQQTGFNCDPIHVGGPDAVSEVPV
ncbi:hypothetical protein C2W62_39655 [Candidatus Entotheonella serta]|nr:hypothetical protein C2W62_39655 [Candidatus Entotheonella serta]